MTSEQITEMDRLVAAMKDAAGQEFMAGREYQEARTLHFSRMIVLQDAEAELFDFTRSLFEEPTHD